MATSHYPARRDSFQRSGLSLGQISAGQGSSSTVPMLESLSYNSSFQADCIRTSSAPSGYIPAGYTEAGSRSCPLETPGYASQGYFNSVVEDTVASHQNPRGITHDESPIFQEAVFRDESDDQSDTDSESEDAPARKRRRTVRKQPNQQQSARAAKRALITRKFGSVGSDNKAKGRIQRQGDRIIWWDEGDQKWRRAAFHNDYRHVMILEDSANETYDFDPEHGLDRDDVTSFASALGQQHWNLSDRDSWGNIRDEEGNEVLYLIDKPGREQDPPEPGPFMMYNGLILLDPDNHPVKDFPDVPRVFSSKLEGARIEAFRRIYNMNLLDFRARMPLTIKTVTGVKDLFGLTSLNQRVSRFREHYDCPPWRHNLLKRQTKKRVKREGLRSNMNSTKGLRPLTRLEIEKRRLPGRGKHLEKAQGRAISKRERDERDRKHANTLRRLEERQKRDSQSNKPNDQGVVDQGTSANDLLSSVSVPSNRRKRDYEPSSAPSDEWESRSPEVKRHRQLSATKARLDSAQVTVSFAFTSTSIHDANTENEYSDDFMDPSVMVDIRLVKPSNPSEQFSINAALFYTRLDYRSLTGREAPATPNAESYMFQYLQIEEHHRAYWAERGVCPNLVSIGEWYGGFGMVPIPMLSDEVYSRLLRVPTDLHGETPGMISPESIGHETLPRYGLMVDVNPQHTYSDLGETDWQTKF